MEPDPLLQASAREDSPYQALKLMLMSGALGAGEKLQPAILAERFSISASAMREIFLRLSGEGLLIQKEQRGFCVGLGDPATLAELSDLRIIVECGAVEKAIEHKDLDWEARLTAAHHKLAHVESRLHAAETPGDIIPLWTRVDWEFHETLLSTCPSRMLRAYHRKIYEHYRMQVVATVRHAGFFGPDTIAQHEAILNAAIAGDVEACRRAIGQHVDIVRAHVLD